MKRAKFLKFWSSSTKEWIKTAKYTDVTNSEHPVSEICNIKANYAGIMFHNYSEIKELVKQNYFKDDVHRSVSRYKRAAILMYTIIKSDPIVYKKDFTDNNRYFLKQRLAVFIALNSILVDYDESDVKSALKEAKKTDSSATVFGLKNIGKEKDVKQDSFYLSLLKDLEFAEIYNHFDVLAMANILGLITEYCSILTTEMLVDRKKNFQESDIESTATKAI